MPVWLGLLFFLYKGRLWRSLIYHFYSYRSVNHRYSHINLSRERRASLVKNSPATYPIVADDVRRSDSFPAPVPLPHFHKHLINSADRLRNKLPRLQIDADKSSFESDLNDIDNADDSSDRYKEHPMLFNRPLGPAAVGHSKPLFHSDDPGSPKHSGIRRTHSDANLAYTHWRSVKRRMQQTPESKEILLPSELMFNIARAGSTGDIKPCSDFLQSQCSICGIGFNPVTRQPRCDCQQFGGLNQFQVSRYVSCPNVDEAEKRYKRIGSGRRFFPPDRSAAIVTDDEKTLLWIIDYQKQMSRKTRRSKCLYYFKCKTSSVNLFRFAMNSKSL